MPVTESNRQSQAARIAASAVTTDPTARILATKLLLGTAEFFGTKDDAKVRLLLQGAGVDVARMDRIFAEKVAQ